MKSKSNNILRSIAATTGVVILALIFVFSYWLISIRGQAKSMPFLSRYVEFKLGNILHDCDVSIGNSNVIWLNKEKKVIINHYRIAIDHKTKPASLELPRLTYELNYSRLLPFKLTKVAASMYDLAANYKIAGSSADTRQHETAPVMVNQQLRGEDINPDRGVVAIKEKKLEAKVAPSKSEEQAYLAAVDNLLRPLFKYMSSMNADFILGVKADDTVVHITRDNKEEKLFLPLIATNFSSNAEKVLVDANIRGMDSERNIKLKANAQYFHQEQRLDAKLKLENLPTSILSPFVFEDDSYIDFVLNGDAGLSVHNNVEDGHLIIDSFNLNVVDSKGAAKLANLGSKAWKVDDIHINMSHDGANRRIVIPVIAARVQQVANINGNGFWYFSNPEYLATFKVAVDHIPYSDLIELWPNEITPTVKLWMKEHFRGGEVRNIKANFVIDHSYRVSLPADQVLASLNLHGAQLKYLDQFPEVKQLDASAAFYPNRVDITIMDAISNNSKVFGTVVIPYRKGGEVKIKLNTKGIIRDLLEFNKDSIPQIEKFLPLSSLTGEAESKVNLSFPIKENIEVEDLDILVEASANNVAGKLSGGQSKDGINFSNGSIKGKFNGKVIEISGECEVFKQPLNLEMRVPIETGPDYIKLTTTLTPRNPELSSYILEGELPISLVLKLEGDAYGFKLETSPSRQSLSIPEILFVKSADTPLEFSVRGIIEPAKDIIKVEDLSLIAGEQRIKGEMDYDIVENAFTRVEMPEFKTGKQHLAISGAIQPKRSEWSINGTRLSLSPRLLTLFGKEKKTAKHKVPKGERIFDFAVDELVLVGGALAKNAKVSYHCNEMECRYISANIKVDDEHFINLSIDPKASPPFLLEGESLGSMLEGLSIGSNFKGGKISAKGELSEGDKKAMSGEFVLSDFALSGNTLLARLLSLTTIPGIIKISKHLEFEKVKGNFGWEKKELQLDKVRSYGAKLGITATGFVNFASEEMVLKGELYPALYGFNYALKNIPIIGAILTGEGNTGVFAAGYRIGGSFDNPSYSVNPFSIIKPGILRDIF